jgi:hypothetical protein
MHLAPALALGAGSKGMIQETKSVCMPAVGISVVTPDFPASWADGCIAFNDQVLDWLATQPSVKLVVVSSPLGLIEWDVYQRGGQVATGPRPDLVRAALVEAAERVRAMGKDFVIVSPTPGNGENLGRCLVETELARGPQDGCDFRWSRGNLASFTFLQDLSDQIPIVFLDEMICPCSVCKTRSGDVFLYATSGLLTFEGARFLEETYGLYSRIRMAAKD